MAYATAAAVGDFPGRAEFAAKFKAAYGTDPTGYSATGYACAQVFLDALKRAGPTATSVADLREKLRAATVDTSVTYTSVIGQFKFDANGDTSQKVISFYAYDPASRTGRSRSSSTSPSRTGNQEAGDPRSPASPSSWTP